MRNFPIDTQPARRRGSLVLSSGLSVLAFALLVACGLWLAPGSADAAINPRTQTDAIGLPRPTIAASELIAPDSVTAPAVVPPSAPAEPRQQLPKQQNANPLTNWALVDVSQQRIYFYDGAGNLIRTALVRTGKYGYDTNLGTHRIWRRVRVEHMVGADYDLPGVNFTQYFDSEMEGLHEAYWVQPGGFGTRGSHGCVNLDYGTAKFAWDFLTYGSVVKVVP